jgi:putative tricarboxylic transport membrane protein
VLTAHGLAPGQELMTTHLHLVFVLIWSLFISNWLTSLIGLGIAPSFARLTIVPVQRVVPWLIVISALAAYVVRNQMLDVVVAFGFGIAGYYLKRYDWPRIPFVIAVVLAPVFERNLYLTWQLHALGKLDFWSRPLTILFAALLLVSAIVAWVRRRA